jgi:hypothetical protein
MSATGLLIDKLTVTVIDEMFLVNEYVYKGITVPCIRAPYVCASVYVCTCARVCVCVHM